MYEKTITHALENASIKAFNKFKPLLNIWCFKGRHIQSLLANQLLSTFHFSVRYITAALKRTAIKDVEHELKSVRSPKSKKVKRELSFDSSNKGDVNDDDGNDNKDLSDNNNDTYHSLSTKREEKQQHEEVEFHNGGCRVPISAHGKTAVMSTLETMKVLLNPDTEYVCAQVPV